VFKLSRKGEYALRAVFYLSASGSKCTTDEIAEKQAIPKPFLKKILQSLSVAGLISSTKGPKGGISLNVSPKKLSVKEVIEKIEGPLMLNKCLSCSGGGCSFTTVCPFHEVWAECQQVLQNTLESMKFSDLVKRHKELLISSGRENESDATPSFIPIADFMPKLG